MQAVRALATAAAALLVVLAVARPAAAHPMDVGYLRIDLDGATARVELDIDVNLAALLLGADPHALDDATVHARADALATATYRAEPITSGGRPCAWTAPTVSMQGRTVSLSDAADCSSVIRTMSWEVPLAARAPSTFKLLVKANSGGNEQASIVDRDKPVIEVAGGAASSVGFGDFVMTGIAHIGATPSEWRAPGGGLKLPDGIDHILFVLALLLAGGTLRQIAGIATGFTVGHTITLALATLDVVRPAPAVIEPLIALSIAIVAAEALSGKLPKYRWKVATFFGLIHGFGFARALQNFDLARVNRAEALFGYNLGVEIGQLTIIVIVFPLLVLGRRFHYSKIFVTRVAPALILVAGLWWFVERVFITPPV
jgi:hypothetical protein